MCVKEFKHTVSASAVQREAELMNRTDHPSEYYRKTLVIT